MGSNISLRIHSPPPHGPRGGGGEWMRDERTSEDVCGEARVTWTTGGVLGSRSHTMMRTREIIIFGGTGQI